MAVNCVGDELGRTWKEAYVFCFEVLSQHLPGGTGEIKGNLTQNGRFFGPRFEHGTCALCVSRRSCLPPPPPGLIAITQVDLLRFCVRFRNPV
jgi:hypothetical protein